MLGWLKDRRRKALLASPFPDAWNGFVTANLPFFQSLTEDEQGRLRDAARIFIAEKDWEAVGGLEMSDEIRVTIAFQACLLTLNMEGETYPNLQSILVYPGGYRARRRDQDPSGVVRERKEPTLGEAWTQGPVVLSWYDVVEGARDPRDGWNLVFHEFAHKLDFLDGSADGVPRLYDAAQYETWAAAMSAAFHQHVEDTYHGRETLLDPYAAESPAEFFAVATECFFEQGPELAARLPALYDALRGYYRQDTAERLAEIRPGQ